VEVHIGAWEVYCEMAGNLFQNAFGFIAFLQRTTQKGTQPRIQFDLWGTIGIFLIFSIFLLALLSILLHIS